MAHSREQTLKKKGNSSLLYGIDTEVESRGAHRLGLRRTLAVAAAVALGLGGLVAIPGAANAAALPVAKTEVVVTPTDPVVSGAVVATVPMAGVKSFTNTYEAGGSGAVSAALKTAPTAPAEVTFDTSVAGKPQVKFDAKGAAAGVYTFSVTYTDELSDTVDQEFTVTVQAAPEVAGKTVRMGASMTGRITTEVTGTNVTGVITSAPTAGSVIVLPSNDLNYTSVATAGDVFFTVTYTDDLGQAVSAVYRILVQAKPVATAKTALVGVSKAVTIPSGVTGTSVKGSVVTPPTEGTVSVDASNNVTYTASATGGVYGFEMGFTDDLGQLVKVTYTVTVQAAPLVSGVTSARVAQTGVAVYDQVSVETLGSITDAKITKQADAGTATVDPTTKVVSYETKNVKAGDYTFEVTYTDDQGSTTTAPFTVTVVNQFTVETELAYASVATGVKALRGEPSAGAVIAKRELLGQSPAAGTATIASDATTPVTYDPIGASVGLYSFWVRYTDDVGQIADVQYQIRVLPELTGTGKVVSVEHGTKQVVVDPLGTVGSGDLLALEQKDLSKPTTGTLAITGGSAQVVTWSVPSGYSGSTSFTVTVKDRAGQSVKLTYTVTVGAAVPVCAPPRTQSVFADVKLGQKFYTEIDWMQCTSLSTGTRQASGKPLYKPKDGLTREAMAAFMYRLVNPEGYVAPTVSPFADLEPGDNFYKQITWMYDSGLSTGTRQQSGKPMYEPKDLLTREAMAAFIYRLEAPKKYSEPSVSPFTDMTPDSQFYTEVSWMYDAKLSTGNSTPNGKEYWPKSNLSREATAAFVYRLVTDHRKK